MRLVAKAYVRQLFSVFFIKKEKRGALVFWLRDFILFILLETQHRDRRVLPCARFSYAMR